MPNIHALLDTLSNGIANPSLGCFHDTSSIARVIELRQFKLALLRLSGCSHEL
jgi:hypothetical protein